jgi:hypothetical protein
VISSNFCVPSPIVTFGPEYERGYIMMPPIETTLMPKSPLMLCNAKPNGPGFITPSRVVFTEGFIHSVVVVVAVVVVLVVVVKLRVVVVTVVVVVVTVVVVMVVVL